MQAAIASIFQTMHPIAEAVAGRAAAMFLSPASLLSVQAMGCALLIALIFTVSRRRRDRPLRLRVIRRALFPRRLIASRSGRADIKMFLFNALAATSLFGWAIISAGSVYRGVGLMLTALFGSAPAAPIPHWLGMGIATITLFLAFEFAYWLDHFLSHKIPLLWHFHKVHHSAESLSPLTNYRIHPVNSVIFINIVALVTGSAGAALTYLLGGEPGLLTIGGVNILLVASTWLLTHLLHTHLWIAFRGPAGRLFQSPAHHQLHHSSAPAHRDCNFGASLALFDWLFGTLIIPPRKRPALLFGVTGETSRHDLPGIFVAPFVDAARMAAGASPAAAPALKRRTLS